MSIFINDSRTPVFDTVLSLKSLQTMAGNQDIVKDEKSVVEMELDSAKRPSEDEIEPITSAYASFTRAALMRKFWRLYLTGLMVSLGGM